MAVRSYLAGLARRLAAAIEGGVPRLRIAEQAVRDPVRFANELFDSIPVALSMRSHCTCPAVSQAASMPSGVSLKEYVLIGHAPTFQSCSFRLVNVVP